jgi:rfaE bifunctional protein nucleotidyltransferase chain/domain
MKRKKVVFTNGCFDILHMGHVTYLEKARKLGDWLVVGVNSDASVRRLKGPSRPVNSQKDRARVLSSLRCVDRVVVFHEDTPEKLIRKIRPDVLVKGGDWKKQNVVGAGFVESYGGKVRLIKFVKGFSTTGLLSKIQRL